MPKLHRYRVDLSATHTYVIEVIATDEQAAAEIAVNELKRDAQVLGEHLERQGSFEVYEVREILKDER